MNTTALKTYAQAFASRACDRFFGENFFSQKEYIYGREILSFSPVEQVNYFVLFQLFSQWQKEAARLQSPYFDYAQPEVKAAMEQFMNTLSRHMKVRRGDFEPVVASATEAALRLLINPREQVKELLKTLDSQPLTNARLQEHSRYVRMNKPLWEALLTKIDQIGKNPVDFPTAVVLLNEVLAGGNNAQHSILEKPETHLPQFSTIMPLQLSDLQEDGPSAAQPENATEAAQPVPIEEIPAEENAKWQSPAPTEPPQTIEKPPLKETHVIEPPLPPAALAPETKAEIEHFVKSAIRPVAPLAAVLAEKNKPEETVFGSLQEKMNREHTTLNQVLGSEKDGSLSEKVQNQRIGSIKEALNLNQKYYFINGLFNGDNVAFAQAIHELEQCATLPAATQLLQNKYAPVFDWDTASEEYGAFVDVIGRKLAP